MRTYRRRGRAVLGALLAVATLSACGDEGGPGTIEVEITADIPLVAASVELIGDGIEGVEQTPGQWAEGEPLDTPEGTPGYRAVVVLESAGPVVLTLRVADTDAALPEVEVLEAVGADDRPRPSLANVQARVRR